MFQDPCHTTPHPSAANSHITASIEESARTTATVGVPASLTQKSVIVSCVACPTLPSPPRLAAAPELLAASAVNAAAPDGETPADADASLGDVVSFLLCPC